MQMRRGLVYIGCVMILIASTLRALAQENFKFSSYTVDNGLPQSSIWSIIQDRNGFLWVSTSDGLCRFDGYEFTVFKNIPGDTNSIAAKSNANLFEDSEGNIWIGHDLGISKYDIVTNKFINIYRYNKLPQGGIFNRLLGQDSKGYLWAGVMSVGLLKIDIHTNKIVQTVSSAHPALTDDAHWFSGFTDARDRIWFTKRTNGVYCYDIAKGRINKYLDIYPGNAVVPFGKGRMLMSSNDELLLFDMDTHALTVLDQSKWDEHLRVKNEVFNAVYDHKNHLWLCNQDGAYVFDTVKKKVIKRFSSFSQAINNYSYCHTAFCDHSGNVWIGTNGDGLKKLMNDTKGFRTYATYLPGGSIVKSIYVRDSIIYAGCFNNGVDVYSIDTGFMRKVSTRQQKTYPWIQNIYAFADFNEHMAAVYGASAGAGCHIALLDLHNDSYTDLTKQLYKDIHDLGAPNGVPFLINTRQGILFDWGYSLVLMTGNTPQDVHFKELNYFEHESLNCGFEAKNGLLYVGGSTSFFMQRPGNKWMKGALPGEQYVKTICEDAAGNIWVGTTNGIFIFDTGNHLLKHYDVQNGLKNEFIYGILRDNRGRMWFSHNKGISVYDFITNSFHHYSAEDGLQSNEFNTNAYLKMPNGVMLFGGINGISFFNPEYVKDNPSKPSVRITGIKVLDDPLKTDSAYWNMKTLKLPYDRNSLTIDFTALEFTNPGRNTYAYMMKNLDNKWIKAGEDHRARYPSLPPGEYIFMVKAANNDGVWQDEPATLVITIVPPFWQQWWFRMLYILGSIGVLWGVTSWLQRQRHKRQIRELELQQKIQLERERISRDLHDNVGTQLSLISNNIEWVTHPLKEITEHEKSEKLQFVNDTARGIIATLRETIWALNKEQISLEEFSDKFKAFVQKQMALYPQTDLNYTDQIEEKVILGPSEALNLFRICQEAVANSLKYAEANTLDIRVQTTEGKYRVNIADDGKGFDIAKVDPSVHNGLENMKYRANDIAGKLELVSAVNKGTIVTITKK